MATHKYRYTGSEPVHVPSLNKEVKPDEVVPTDEKINHPDFEEMREHKKGESKKDH